MAPEEITAVCGGIALVVGPALVWLDNRRKASVAGLQAQMNECDKVRGEQAHRITALEAANLATIPSWKRTQDGVFVSASPGFVRLLAAPLGYKAADIIGKRFDDLPRFDPGFVKAMAEMEAEVLLRGRACRHGVRVGPTAVTTVTVIKEAASDQMGNVVFIGYACDE